jgi:hypothetical protein
MLDRVDFERRSLLDRPDRPETREWILDPGTEFASLAVGYGFAGDPNSARATEETWKMTRNHRFVRSRPVAWIATAVLALGLPGLAAAHPEPEHTADHKTEMDNSMADQHGSLSNVSAKLSNPVSDVWALFTQFGITFSDGDANTNDPKLAGLTSFQPILPIPLFGEGEDEWRLIMRPTIPIQWSNPVPKGGVDNFNRKTGLGDTLLPLVAAMPAGNWILAAGPTFTLPTSTKDAFGRQQWAMGPAGVFGYKTKDYVVGVFPQYFFGIGSRGDQGKTKDASYMSLLYFAYLNLQDAWQVGFNPSISYDNKASRGNKWNVPIGLVVAKTVAIAKKPVKFQFGFEYSVVSQDDFGQRFMVKLNVIPVIQSLIDDPIFGGN